jgi:hypothetical protein
MGRTRFPAVVASRPTDVPKEIVAIIVENIVRLRAEWDAMYPSNPVARREADDD